MQVVFHERALRRALFGAAVGVSLLGLVAELLHQLVPSARSPLLAFFSLSCEGNLAGVLAYSLGAELVDLKLEMLWSITMVVALLHFYYDGFIWSVAKR